MNALNVFLTIAVLPTAVLSACVVENETTPQSIQPEVERNTFMSSIPCSLDEIDKFVSLYADSQHIQKLFTADPIIVTHLDLNTPPNATKKTVYGQKRLSLIAEVITPGRFSTKKMDNDHFQARKKDDSQYLHTFVNNGTCWYYTELADKSEEACPGLSEDECERLMEPDDEGIGPE